MTTVDFAEIVTTMIKCEKETFMECISKENWDELKEEIFYYAESCMEEAPH